MLTNPQMLTLNIGILLNIIAAVLIFYIWTENKKKYADMKYFFISITFCIISFLGLFFHKEFVNSFNLIVFLCGLGYYGFLLIGFQKFYSVKTALYTPIVCGVITLFLTIYSYKNQHFLFIKIFSFAIVMMLTIQLIIVLWKHRGKYKYANYEVSAILLFQLILRTYILFSASSLTELHTSPVIFSICVFTLPMSKVFISLATVFLTDRRRKTDVVVMNKTIENVFTLSSEGIVINSLSGNFLHINNSFCEMTGYSKKELQKFSWKNLIHQKDIKEIKQLYRKSRDGYQENTNFQVETRIVRNDKSIIWVIVTISLVIDLNKEPLYFISNIARINELKTRTMELEISEKNLRIAKEKAEKLSKAKSDF